MSNSINYIGSVLLVLVLQLGFTQKGLYVPFEKAKENPEQVRFLYIAGDSISMEEFKEMAPSFSSLAGLAVDGKVGNSEHLWSALLKLNMLQELILKNNELKQLNIGASSSTLQLLWIIGSPKISSANIDRALEQAEYLRSLRIIGIEDPALPTRLGQLNILENLQISQTNWQFELILSLLNPNHIKSLNLSDNNFQSIGKGLKSFKKISCLDLSGNELMDLPKQMKHLNALDSLVLNRNHLTKIQDEVKSLQKLAFSYLVLPEDSVTNRDDFEYALPGKEILWSNNVIHNKALEIPLTYHIDKKKVVNEESINLKYAYESISGSSKSVLLSPAYLIYETLHFANPLKSFDSTTYEDRYLDSTYQYVKKMQYQNLTEDGHYYKLKYNSGHGNWYKGKKKRKIKHRKHSPLLIEVLKTPSELEGIILFSIKEHSERTKRKELNVYKSMVWETMEHVDEASFKEAVITQKLWSDVRINYDSASMEHTITLKGRYETISFPVQGRKLLDLTNIEAVIKTYAKLDIKYQKNLAKNGARFNKKIIKKKKKRLKPHKKETYKLWNMVEEKMSDEEKEMDRYQWRQYYAEMKKNEFGLLSKVPLDMAYLSRLVEAHQFTRVRGNDFFVGQKRMAFSIIDEDSSIQTVKDFCLFDLDRKLVKYFDGDSLNYIQFAPFHQYIAFGQLEDGKVFEIDNEQIIQLWNKGENGKFIIPKRIDFGYSTNGAFYKQELFPIMKELVY